MLPSMVDWVWKIRKALTLFVLTGIVPVACPAADLESAANRPVDSRAALVSPARDPIDQSRGATSWDISIEAIALGRSNNVNQALVSRVPGGNSFYSTAVENGAEAFNSNQFQQGFAVGPKLTLTYHADAGYGMEVSYFSVANMTASKTIGPDNPGNWLVMKAPGGFWQTQDFPNQGMLWGATTTLYNAEVNARLEISKQSVLLAGFRWIQLSDSLTGSLTPADQNAPSWKTGPAGGCYGGNPSLYQIDSCAVGAATNGYPPFWRTSTINNLFGLQAGAEGTLFEVGRFSFGGFLKAGVFNNRASQTGWVSMEKQMYSSDATTNQAAFMGEGGIQIKYAIADDLLIKVGYNLLWLGHVALAPGQIPQTRAGQSPTSITATGVNAGSNILFQGVTAGLQYSF